MIKSCIASSIFIFCWIFSCTSSPSFFLIEEVNVVKTSRDSTYLKDQKPFTGQVKKINKQGTTLESFFVKEGKLNGKYQNYYTSGALKLNCSYTQGVLQGVWVSFYENKQEKELINYDKGYMQGQRKSFWNNGLIKEENEFNKGVLTGTSNFYYPNGQLRKTIAFDFNGNREGDWIDYYPNGNVKQKISYKSGKIIDSLVRYDIKGKIISNE
jgi:antitoxin component YwqK of YwqJK toxin-antitoxin module